MNTKKRDPLSCIPAYMSTLQLKDAGTSDYQSLGENTLCRINTVPDGSGSACLTVKDLGVSYQNTGENENCLVYSDKYLTFGYAKNVTKRNRCFLSGYYNNTPIEIPKETHSLYQAAKYSLLSDTAVTLPKLKGVNAWKELLYFSQVMSKFEPNQDQTRLLIRANFLQKALSNGTTENNSFCSNKNICPCGTFRLSPLDLKCSGIFNNAVEALEHSYALINCLTRNGVNKAFPSNDRSEFIVGLHAMNGQFRELLKFDVVSIYCHILKN